MQFWKRIQSHFTAKNHYHRDARVHPLNHGYKAPRQIITLADLKDPSSLATFFPILRSLEAPERIVFLRRVETLRRHPNFIFRVWDVNRIDVTVTIGPMLSFIVAAHISEILFRRPDLSVQFISEPRYFNIYVDERAYAIDGGVAGGCYDPGTESIKLVASRLLEGFQGKTPGVAPFIHEFGHMLDSFNVATGKMGLGRGLLPGMFEADGDIFTPAARVGFIEGKRIELDRYERARETRPSDPNDIPLGHPYVFQSDGEFIAGYVEMFFRNPHSFAQLNPALYDGLAALFKQDPRNYWEQDFPLYIDENRKVYLGHRRGIHPARLRVFA